MDKIYKDSYAVNTIEFEWAFYTQPMKLKLNENYLSLLYSMANENDIHVM